MRISARKLQNGTIQVAHGEPGWEIVFAEFQPDDVNTVWRSTVLPPAIEPWGTEVEPEGEQSVAEVHIGNKKFTLPIPVEAKEGQRLFFRVRDGKPEIYAAESLSYTTHG